MEIFKDIIDYEGMYQISNYGRVKSLKFGKEKILKFGKDKDGYLYVHLCRDGKLKNYRVHRLVASAFIPNPNELPEVNHRNEDKTLNTVENLEWMEHQDNCNYGTRNERCSIKHSKQVNQYTLDDKLIATYPSTREVERELGFSQGNISMCCNGKYKTSYGYKWKYA